MKAKIVWIEHLCICIIGLVDAYFGMHGMFIINAVNYAISKYEMASDVMNMIFLNLLSTYT